MIFLILFTNFAIIILVIATFTKIFIFHLVFTAILISGNKIK